MAEPLHVMAMTTDDVVLEVQEALWVHLALANGHGVTVWPGHAPLLAETTTDTLSYEDASGQHRVDLPGGILYVRENEVTVLLGSGPGSRSAPTPGPFVRLAQALREMETE